METFAEHLKSLHRGSRLGVAGPCMGKAAPHSGSEQDTAAALPSLGSCHRSCSDPAEQRGGVEQCPALPFMAQCRTGLRSML